MQVLASHIAHLALATYRDNQVLGYLGEPIVDIDKLAVAAFYCRLPQSQYQTPVILFRDICEFGQGLVVISSEEDIEDLSELVRIKQLVQVPFTPLNKSVVTQSGHRLGSVIDYTISVTSYEITKLYVKRPLFSSFVVGNTIIDRSQILEVTNRKFIVRDATARVQRKSLSAQLTSPILPE